LDKFLKYYNDKNDLLDQEWHNVKLQNDELEKLANKSIGEPNNPSEKGFGRKKYSLFVWQHLLASERIKFVQRRFGKITDR